MLGGKKDGSLIAKGRIQFIFVSLVLVIFLHHSLSVDSRSQPPCIIYFRDIA